MIYDLELKSKVKREFNGQSVIDYLTDRFTYKTKEEWLEIFLSGKLLVNGEKANSDQILNENDCLSFVFPNYFEPDLNCNYHIIYENENIIVVSKPANLPISSNHRFFKQNMTALLRNDTHIDVLNPIHRLDRETSGLLIYLKKKFDKPYKLRKSPLLIMKEKYYLAIVRGNVYKSVFSVNVPLTESNIPPIGYKIIEAKDGMGKEASTDFVKLGNVDGLTLLLAKLNTGRKHQIRVHCAISGFPIVGDKLYSYDGKYYLKRFNDEELTFNDYEILGATHHLLHAYAIKLELPENKEKLVISNYFSDEYKKYLNLFFKDESKLEQKVIEIIGNKNPLDL